MKTAFYSYAHRKPPRGCELCVQGKKLVLFMGGTCTRNCWYCSLSNSRSKDVRVMANERPVKTIKDLFEEVQESNATGAGITGGDPLVYFPKVLTYVRALKKKFGKTFHLHIYLPLHLVNKKRLQQLHKYIDEIRFHPSIFTTQNQTIIEKEIEKIKLATQIFGKRNVGLELPLIPGKRELLLEYLLQVKQHISFLNLNELEISETNIDLLTKRFTLNEDTHTIRGSLTDGKWIIQKAKKLKIPVAIHFCTAKTKEAAQYKNRLKQHNTLPYGKKTKEGTVVYFCMYPKNKQKDIQTLSSITKNFYEDTQRKRIIIKMSDVLKVYEDGRINIARIEEYPTYGNERIEFSWIGT